MPFDLAHFYSRTRDARKIIVVDLGFLGDTVQLVPALWELQRGYPGAQIHVLTSPVGAEVLRLVPCVTRAWALEMDRERRTFRQQWQTLSGLRREHFDLAFNFSGADRTIFMTWLTGARWRVAYPGGRWHFWNQWLIPNWAPSRDPNRTVFEQRREVLADCGLDLAPARYDLRIDEASTRWASSVTPKNSMHISVSSAKATREWSIAHHVEMLRAVWKKHPEVTVVLSAAAKERERQRLSELAQQVRDSRLKVLPEGLTIPQLAAVLCRCRLHLGPDSGVLHLAVALGVPTISFFREQGAYRSFMPVGPQHQVISMPCTCIDSQNAPCERLGYAECFTRIVPSSVTALIDAQLSR
jgi:ADP-heptose:LPS heptosyltransferase